MSVAHVPHVPQFQGKRERLAALLDEIDVVLTRFVAFPSDEARHATAAWVVHTWIVEHFESTPRIAFLSAEKGSGKTRTLEVIEHLVPHALHTVNVSAAALFRKVSEGRCTLLLDEADTYLGTKIAQQHEDLRGLINAGHRRGAVAYRCSVGGKGVNVEEFPAFAPVALAGIGDLPDTILDRSVVVAMKRRAPHEKVEPFRLRLVKPELERLAQRIEVWAHDFGHDVGGVFPDMPDGIVDRPADVWEPLIAIGDYAGGVWEDRIRCAAVTLNKLRAERDPSLGVRLLADCREVFGTDDRLTTEELLERLIALDESPWGSIRGEPLDARGLARRLRPYDVRPGKHRFGDATRKGYLRVDFYDAWLRYLPSLSSPGTGEQGEQEEHAVDVSGYEADYPELFGEGAA